MTSTARSRSIDPEPRPATQRDPKRDDEFFGDLPPGPTITITFWRPWNTTGNAPRFGEVLGPRTTFNSAFLADRPNEQLTLLARDLRKCFSVSEARSPSEVIAIRERRRADASALHKLMWEKTRSLDASSKRSERELQELEAMWQQLMELRPIPFGARLKEHRPREVDGELFHCIASVTGRRVISVIRAVYAHLDGAPVEWGVGNPPKVRTAATQELEHFAKREANRVASQRVQHDRGRGRGRPPRSRR